MKINRRKILQFGSCSALFATVTGFTKSVFAEWPTESFDKTVYDEAFALVTGGEQPQAGDVKIDAPEIASNGATVPITISAKLENLESINVLVENNPRPYISTFYMNDMLEPSISLRVKMRETSNVVAIAKTSSGQFIAKQSVKVTAGGCA